MSEKKQSGNVSYAFMDKAGITERQSIRLAIENLAHKDPSIKEGYDDLLAKQEKSRQVVIEKMTEQSDKEIQTIKQMLLDEHDVRKKNKPVYKPRWWPGVGRPSLAKAAEKDAQYIVVEDARRKLRLIDEKFTEERRQYLSDAVKLLQRHTETFNRSSDTTRMRGGMDSQSQNREGYER